MPQDVRPVLRFPPGGIRQDRDDLQLRLPVLPEVDQVLRGQHVKPHGAAHPEVPHVLLPDELQQDIPHPRPDLFLFPRRNNPVPRQAAGLLPPGHPLIPVLIDILLGYSHPDHGPQKSSTGS